MGSGDWFKTMISSKRVKDHSSKQGKVSSAHSKLNGFKWKSRSSKNSAISGSAIGNKKVADVPPEVMAATIIQTAFRAYMARKLLRRLRGRARLQILTQNYNTKKQATSTLNHLHSWSKIQSQIKARRACMVTEGRTRQKKLENQLKLEAKLHDLEVEWNGGAETMEEVLARVHLREEAAVKRERAMAYAFSHQWRANSRQGLGSYELGKANWGWSWVERWIAARPWESRVPDQLASPKKVQNKPGNKVGKNSTSPSMKPPASIKPPLSNGNKSTSARRLSYPPAEKQSTSGGSAKPEEATIKRVQSVS